MKPFLAAVALLCPLITQCAYADSISTFHVQANIPFQAGQDNQYPPATFTGSGANITTSDGDVVCDDWCSVGGSLLVPGSTLKPNINVIYFGNSQGSVTFGGQVHPVQDLFGAPAITALGSFQFPTNGRNFTVSVPAMIGLIVGDTLDMSGNFNLQIPPGKLVLTFDFFPGGNGVPPFYQFSHGTFTTTPEPGTLGLIASGLAAIVGAVLKRKQKTTIFCLRVE